jgi:hypothetical protein
VFKDGLKITGKFEELLVEGHGSLLFAFNGDPENFDPLSMPGRTWGGLYLSDCHNVTVHNLEVWGGAMQAVHLDDSYPSTGLYNARLEDVTVYYGSPRGIFMGGHNISGVSLVRCKVRETCYGDTTHGIYLSGGHWRGDYPAVKGTRIQDCEVSYSGGRHGIQLNGRFDGVLIKGCRSFHNQRTSLSLIGTQNVTVEDCVFWGNCDQGMVVYDYFDYGYFNINEPEEFKACHHPNKNILVRNCTIAVGDKPWKIDEWHHHNPKGKPAVLVNCNLGELFPDFRPAGIEIEKCVLWTPWKNLVEFGHSFDASATKLDGNLCWGAEGEPLGTVTGKHVYTLTQLQQQAPSHYRHNIFKKPEFVEKPNYTCVDLTQIGPFNFAHHSSHANLYSKPAADAGVGAKLPHPHVHVEGEHVEGKQSEHGEPGETSRLPWEE